MRAIITVSDKTDVVKLSNFLLKNDFTIYSTGGTFREISDNVNINYQNRVLQVSDLTHFPEILNGRVKTLHPHIYAGVLADSSCHEHSIDMDRIYRILTLLFVICILLKRKTLLKIQDGGGQSCPRRQNFTNISTFECKSV